MNHVYLGAVAFGVTLLLASLLLGGKDTGHGDAGHVHDGDGGMGLGWAPVASLRFWVFLFTFGGGAGLALTELGSGAVVAAGGALGIGWAPGSIAIAIKAAVTSEQLKQLLGVDLAAALQGLAGQRIAAALPSPAPQPPAIPQPPVIPQPARPRTTTQQGPSKRRARAASCHNSWSCKRSKCYAARNAVGFHLFAADLSAIGLPALGLRAGAAARASFSICSRPRPTPTRSSTSARTSASA